MNHYYSRIPSDAVFSMFDGQLYARIPHKFNGDELVEDFENARMVRFDERSFVREGEAYVWFARRGDALPAPEHVPYGVSVVHVQNAPEGSA